MTINEAKTIATCAYLAYGKPLPIDQNGNIDEMLGAAWGLVLVDYSFIDVEERLKSHIYYSTVFPSISGLVSSLEPELSKAEWKEF